MRESGEYPKHSDSNSTASGGECDNTEPPCQATSAALMADYLPTTSPPYTPAFHTACLFTLLACSSKRGWCLGVFEQLQGSRLCIFFCHFPGLSLSSAPSGLFLKLAG